MQEQPVSVPLEQDANFCGNCGSPVGQIKHQRVTKSVQYIIIFYVAFLILALINNFTYIEDATLLRELILEVLFIIMTIGFCAFDVKGILPLYRFKGIDWKGLLMAFFIPIGSAFFVYYGLSWLHSVLEYYDSNMYAEYLAYEHPMLWAFIFIAIIPPVFEELAFRGFLFNQLRKVASVPVTILATAFIFALIHFSFIAFLWIFPFGMLLGYLRHRYQTLWLGMIVHFIHNFLVLLLDYYYYEEGSVLIENFF